MHDFIYSLIHKSIYPSIEGKIAKDFLYKKVAQDWGVHYGKTVFTPLAYLKSVEDNWLVRAEPFIKEIAGADTNIDATSRFLKLTEQIEEYLLELPQWKLVFDFVKQEIGNLNELLPISQIPHIAREEMPSLAFALSDLLEEHLSVTDIRSFDDVLTDELNTFSKEYNDRYRAFSHLVEN